MFEQKKKYPGDKDYKGGISTTRIYAKGFNKEITVIKDSNGNIKSMFERDLFLGLF